MTRYAIYFAPDAASELWRFGSQVIGYDAASARSVEQWVPDGMDPAEWHALTSEPRHYGFHATLKAPFRLAAGYDEMDLISAVRAHAATVSPFDIDLQVDVLDGFLALVPATAAPGIAALERTVVEAFEGFRAPLNELERERRLRAPLTQRQRTLLEQFGYPYVLDQFRFHMTLSNRLPEEDRISLKRRVEEVFRQRCSTRTPIDRIALFVERTKAFELCATVPFHQGKPFDVG